MSSLPKTGLFYYTSVETMRHVLTGANLFATNLLYMNDAEEYSNGLSELRKIINDRAVETNAGIEIKETTLAHEIEKGSDSYSISFSTSEDLLSQWSMYAGESGVSLKFHFNGNEEYQSYDSEGNRGTFTTKDVKIKPERVFYCTKEAMNPKQYNKVKEKIWKEITSRYKGNTVDDLAGNALLIWKKMTPYVKRFEFNAEGEYRLVVNVDDFNAGKIRIDYRNDENVLKPYIDLKCKGGWPIEEIMVGPGFNQQVVFKSIMHFLNHANLELPHLSRETFISKCNNYLQISEAPDCAKDIWKMEKAKIETADEKLMYKEFCKILDKIKNVVKEKEEIEYLRSLQQRAFTRRGIILKMSKIPYIF